MTTILLSLVVLVSDRTRMLNKKMINDGVESSSMNAQTTKATTTVTADE